MLLGELKADYVCDLELLAGAGQDLFELGTDRFVVACHHNTHRILSSVMLARADKARTGRPPPRRSAGIDSLRLLRFRILKGVRNPILIAWGQLPNCSSYFVGVQTCARAKGSGKRQTRWLARPSKFVVLFSELTG